MRKTWGTTVVVLALVLTGCAGQSKNVTACKLFEDGYNRLTDAAKQKLPAATVVSERDMLPSRISDAEVKAEGDVAVAIRDARELAPKVGTSDGAAFFRSAGTVADKCKADGAAIDLHPTS